MKVTQFTTSEVSTFSLHLFDLSTLNIRIYVFGICCNELMNCCD